MCGIVGCASTEGMKNRSDRLSYMKMGLDIGSWRGWESTGLALVGQTAKEAPIVYKRALNGRDFIQLKTVDKYLSDIEKYPVVIGHNRAATSGRGNIVDHNAHPFQYGKITLVHNGHIRNCHELKGASQGAECQVDSAHVAFSMDANGEQETLEAVDGGFCFVWWNSELETLNIARNNERPLHMAFAAKENSFYFSSELTQLLHLMQDIDIDEETGIMFPKPWVWHKFNLKNLREYTKVPFVQRQGRQQMNTGNMRIHGRTGGPGTTETGSGQSSELTDVELSDLENPDTLKDGTQETTFEIDEIRKELSNQRQKDAKAHGVPTSPKRLKRAKQELKRMGLEYEGMRVCTPKAWVKYKNQDNLGTIVAVTKREGHRVEVLNVRYQEFEEFYKVKILLVDCVNVRKGDRNDDRIIGVVSKRMEGFLTRRKEQAAQKEKEAQERHTEESPRKHVSNSIDRVCPGPRGIYISMARYYELTDNGCANCCTDLLPRDCEDVTWIGESPLCINCGKDPGILELLGIPDHSRAGVH